jgi:Recombination endonuclease VII
VKKCVRCQINKTLDQFKSRKKTKDGLHYYCTPCNREVANTFTATHREERNKRSRENYNSNNEYRGKIMRKFNISLDQFNEIMKETTCAICHKKCISGRRLSIDHSHKTGKIRGLLCTKCNTAIGLLNDNASLFELAIEYLKKHE